jgi:hypothetical protein
MRRTKPLIVVMVLALAATGCRFSRSGSQAIDFDPFANPALKVSDGSGYENGTAMDQRR